MNMTLKLLDSLANGEPKPKKLPIIQVLLIVFFDYRKFISQSQTLNEEYYLTVLRSLNEVIRRKRPDFWAAIY